MNGEKKRAAVCYCLFANEMSSDGMSELLCWCQETFDKAAFRELYQGFAVGSNIQFAVPIKKYPLGFRGVLDESDRKPVYRENLILSYANLRSFMDENPRKRDIGYYLVLLVTDDKMCEDEMVLPILEKYSEMKETYGLKVCCIGVNERKLMSDNSIYTNFIDASGKQGMKTLLMG